MFPIADADPTSCVAREPGVMGAGGRRQGAQRGYGGQRAMGPEGKGQEAGGTGGHGARVQGRQGGRGSSMPSGKGGSGRLLGLPVKTSRSLGASRCVQGLPGATKGLFGPPVGSWCILRFPGSF